MHCVGVLCTFAWMGKGEFLSCIMWICVFVALCIDNLYLYIKPKLLKLPQISTSA